MEEGAIGIEDARERMAPFLVPAGWGVGVEVLEPTRRRMPTENGSSGLREEVDGQRMRALGTRSRSGSR